MAIPDAGFFLGIFRAVASLMGKKPTHPYKKLEARLVDRAIVAEVPEELSVELIDTSGERYSGLYVIGLLIWNRGTQAIIDSDFSEKSPLKIKVGDSAKIVGVNVISEVEDAEFKMQRLDDYTLKVEFDFINPKEFIFLPIFVTGNPQVEVKVTGRFIGQEDPVDQTALEVSASTGERISALILLALLFNVISGLPISTWLIHQNYGFFTIVSDPDSIPRYLVGSFIVGVLMLAMYFCSRLMRWLERRAYPKGFPLQADLEPPLRESIKGLWRTLLHGRKQRVSLSLFDWGKPVVFSDKKLRRRTVEDWIQ
ncbi:hypothetical protein HOP61_02115 [Halomonas daqingensis]|uniref:Uncharacterized protein n=1 Tax=Billgrantia desiderata TaxID=52021 RepID=A0AAW4YMP8_9GAMM|nr:hypothetical protein [Halomonas desiderata]MCE8050092.1 hypothetical protein [Halomonas desiderata]